MAKPSSFCTEGVVLIEGFDDRTALLSLHFQARFRSNAAGRQHGVARRSPDQEGQESGVDLRISPS